MPKDTWREELAPLDKVGRDAVKEFIKEVSCGFMVAEDHDNTFAIDLNVFDSETRELLFSIDAQVRTEWSGQFPHDMWAIHGLRIIDKDKYITDVEYKDRQCLIATVDSTAKFLILTSVGEMVMSPCDSRKDRVCQHRERTGYYVPCSPVLGVKPADKLFALDVLTDKLTQENKIREEWWR